MNILEPTYDLNKERQRRLRNVYRVLLEAAMRAAAANETASPDDLGRTTGEAADASGTFAPNFNKDTIIDETPTA